MITDVKLQVKTKAIENNNLYVKIKVEGKIDDVRKVLKQIIEYKEIN